MAEEFTIKIEDGGGVAGSGRPGAAPAGRQEGNAKEGFTEQATSEQIRVLRDLLLKKYEQTPMGRLDKFLGIESSLTDLTGGGKSKTQERLVAAIEKLNLWIQKNVETLQNIVKTAGFAGTGMAAARVAEEAVARFVPGGQTAQAMARAFVDAMEHFYASRAQYIVQQGQVRGQYIGGMDFVSQLRAEIEQNRAALAYKQSAGPLARTVAFVAAGMGMGQGEGEVMTDVAKKEATLSVLQAWDQRTQRMAELSGTVSAAQALANVTRMQTTLLEGNVFGEQYADYISKRAQLDRLSQIESAMSQMGELAKTMSGIDAGIQGLQKSIDDQIKAKEKEIEKAEAEGGPAAQAAILEMKEHLKRMRQLAEEARQNNGANHIERIFDMFRHRRDGIPMGEDIMPHGGAPWREPGGEAPAGIPALPVPF